MFKTKSESSSCIKFTNMNIYCSGVYFFEPIQSGRFCPDGLPVDVLGPYRPIFLLLFYFIFSFYYSVFIILIVICCIICE